MSKIHLILLTLIFLLALSFIIRAFVSPPFFNTEEVRLAYRGYTLANFGQDELGRSYPFLFNSNEDYQLPVTSYISAFGVKFFGPADFGVRLPFIILGTLLVLLVYIISGKITNNFLYRLSGMAIIAFSPALIYLSQVPNETIILLLMFSLIFYLLADKRINFLLLGLAIILTLATSKLSWYVLPFFIFISLIYFQKTIFLKKKIFIAGVIFLVCIFVMLLYLKIPQASRGLQENDFAIFSSMTLENGISRMRGQGEDRGLPTQLEKIFFNKFIYIKVGINHWLSTMQPAAFFGQGNGFSKILIIPMLLGIVYLLRERAKARLLLVIPLVLTFPAVFSYPRYNFELVLLCLPFMALIIAFGMKNLNRVFIIIILVLMALEYSITLLYAKPSNIQPVISEALNTPPGDRVLISDDITEEIIPYLGWFGKLSPIDNNGKIEPPFRIRQTSIRNISLINSEAKLVIKNDQKEEDACQRAQKVIISNRDLSKLNRMEEIGGRPNLKTTREYVIPNKKAYLLSTSLCIPQ